ncbi:MAG: hypothetical protein JO001_29445 [Alphaproteobacteria bacterium]|nr:hypothetical protein [Alphaproteobacteria bacterium]
MQLWIDSKGREAEIGDVSAVWERGHVYIRVIRNSVVVCLHPALVGPLTMAAAYYAMGDLAPERIYLIADPANGPVEILDGFRSAVRRIAALLAAAESCRVGVAVSVPVP